MNTLSARIRKASAQLIVVEFTRLTGRKEYKTETDQVETIRAEIDCGNPLTTCRLLAQTSPIIKHGWTIVAQGLSLCRPGDVYDRETGARLALRSALRLVPTSEPDVRLGLWSAYLQAYPIADRTLTDEQLARKAWQKNQKARARIEKQIRRHIRQTIKELKADLQREGVCHCLACTLARLTGDGRQLQSPWFKGPQPNGKQIDNVSPGPGLSDPEPVSATERNFAAEGVEARINQTELREELNQHDRTCHCPRCEGEPPDEAEQGNIHIPVNGTQN